MSKTILILINRKISLSCDVASPVDELLYLVLSWESLLGKDEHNDSIGYRISHRIVRLFTYSLKGRIDLFQKMRKLYNARSDYVHGNKLDTSFNLCLYNLKYYKEIIRCCLRKFVIHMIVSQQSYEESVNALDFDKFAKNQVRINVLWQEITSLNGSR